ncbi:MAG: helix-turn-helix transcriptional regulator [Bacteroidota bacterium]
MSEIVRIKSVSEVHKFLGLPQPRHPLVSVIELDDRILNLDYGDVKYTFDVYQVNLKQSFSGSMTYGRNSYDFEDGTLTFIKTGQVIQVENPSTVIEGGSGWTLLFHPDLLRKSELGQNIGDYSFFDYDLHEALHLSEKERVALTALVAKIQEEYNQNIDKYSQELIVANIEMLLKYSKRFYDRQFYTRTNLNVDILTQFNKIIRTYYNSGQALMKGVLTVKECAANLNLSVNYLGDLIRAETGRSAKEHIHEFVIEKAKNRLVGSREGISEIAYDLGFEYPQGFNKLFKSKVGVSPSQYRNLN